MDVFLHADDTDPSPDFDFVINPDTMYPAMIKEIQEIIQDGPVAAAQKLRALGIQDPEVIWVGEGEPPFNVSIQDLSNPEKFRTAPCPIHHMYVTRALNMSGRAFELALEPLSDDMTMGDAKLRADALELARLWFTELLHRAIHHRPMAIRIARSENDHFRLGVQTPSVI